MPRLAGAGLWRTVRPFAPAGRAQAASAGGRPLPRQDGVDPPPRNLDVVVTEDDALAWLTFSGSASPNVVNVRGTGIDFQESDDEHDEVERDVEEVRVENPDDPDQFVDVERVGTILFEDVVTGRLMRLRLRHGQ